MSHPPVPDDDELAQPQPIAWGYLAPPTGYEHAIQQWQEQLIALAKDEGFTIDRWFVDPHGRSDGLTTMWTLLRGSDVQALFVPDPRHLRRLEQFRGMTVQQIKDRLPYQVFMLDYDKMIEFAPVQPPAPPALPHSDRRRRRRGLRWRPREAATT